MDESVELNELCKEPAICGRVSFREADLAYILIDKERMFPLAELLASLFSNTARTTLFTRMEKINTRRHFCNSEEIKLLKTVNGIHGSSAICTLIPEADVKKYCGVYVDRTIDLKQFAKGKRTRNFTVKDEGPKKSKVSESSKSTTAVNSDEESKIVKTSSNDNVNIINPLKRKDRNTSSSRRPNGEAKVKDLRNYENNPSNNESQILLGEVSRSKDSYLPCLSEHVTNGTQTVSLLSEPVVNKPRKKRMAKVYKDHIEQNKRPRNTDLVVSTLCPPSKASIENGIVNSNGNDAPVGSCSSTASSENANISCLAQCLSNANSEILFSDSSSNDSGFGSTATLSLASTAGATSTVKQSSMAKDKPNDKKLAVLKKIKLSLPSLIKLNTNKGTKKKKSRKGVNCENISKLVDPTLSPPALVIKRQNNTWQVETKTELESKAETRTIPKTAKKKLKWSSSESQQSRTQNAISNGQTIVKNKMRKKRGFFDKVNGTINVECKKNAAKKKKMRRRRRKDASALVENSTSVSITTSNDSQTSFNLKSKKKGLLKKSGTKWGKNTEKFRTSQNLEKVKGAHSSNIAMTTSTGSLHSYLNTANKKNPNASKTFKVHKNFKFMSLFTGFPFLGMQDGDLCPTFGMSVPDNIKKPSSHPLWKWHLGGPIIGHDSKRKLNT